VNNRCRIDVEGASVIVIIPTPTYMKVQRNKYTNKYILNFALIHVDATWLQHWFSYVAKSTNHQRGIPGHLSLDHQLDHQLDHLRGCHVASPRCIHVESMWLLTVSYVALSTRHLHRDHRTFIGRLATRQSTWKSTLHIYVESTEIIYVLSTLRLRGCAGGARTSLPNFLI